MSEPVIAPPTEEQVREELMVVCDPEIPVNIVDLGLVYEVAINPEGHVRVEMTLTTMGCPEADALVDQVRDVVEAMAGVKSCHVVLVWSPPWDPEMVSEEGRVMLRIAGIM